MSDDEDAQFQTWESDDAEDVAKGAAKKRRDARDTRVFTPGDPRGYCTDPGCDKWFNTTYVSLSDP